MHARGSPAGECRQHCSPDDGPAGCQQFRSCEVATRLFRIRDRKIGFLRSHGWSHEKAEDFTSAAIEKMLRVGEPIRHLGAYFHQVLRGILVDEIRSVARFHRVAPLFLDPPPTERPFEWLEFEESVNALRSLPGVSDQAVALAVLRWVFGWPTERLIEVTGCSRAAIDQQISRTRRAAARALQDDSF